MSSVSGPRIPYVPDTPDDPRVREVFERQRRRWQGAPVLNLYRVLGWAPVNSDIDNIRRSAWRWHELAG